MIQKPQGNNNYSVFNAEIIEQQSACRKCLPFFENNLLTILFLQIISLFRLFFVLKTLIIIISWSCSSYAKCQTLI